MRLKTRPVSLTQMAYRHNPRGAEDAAIPVLSHTGRQWRGASEPGR